MILIKLQQQNLKQMFSSAPQPWQLPSPPQQLPSAHQISLSCPALFRSGRSNISESEKQYAETEAMLFYFIHGKYVTLAFWIGRLLESSLTSTVDVMISAKCFDWMIRYRYKDENYKCIGYKNLTLFNSKPIIFQNFSNSHNCGNGWNNKRSISIL